ncbi:hypothetical protein C1I97_28000 [Streptomyces sp. NTH33]|uniref:hypothetical protein n=1 Tax=Streptomyces sp. NTH33 TaxID=1735453 RepID=UPI000DA9C2FA|nr:hypothetical protein [Streptomyces sp. NTH33]PZG94126.1 hypothetical protein C1I97_28000 [Streptomyces sp. NTH33]
MEECFRAARNERGPDHCRVRRYGAWSPHITPSKAALAAPTAIRAQELSKRAAIVGEPALLPLSSRRSAA